MAKKDFSKVNTNPVYQTIANATGAAEQEQKGIEARAKQEDLKPLYEFDDDLEAAYMDITAEQPKGRKTYTEKERREIMESRQTSGRKGCKLSRINMAFSPENYEYIKIMAHVRGETMTDFVNHVIKKSMTDHADVYERAQEFRRSL